MVGNALLGSLLVFCGFNTLASKIASFFIGLSFAAVSACSSLLLVMLSESGCWLVMLREWYAEAVLPNDIIRSSGTRQER